MKNTLILICALAAFPLVAQTSDQISFQRTFLLRNISGTAANPGPEPHHARLITRGAWNAFVSGAAFGAYSSETGPEVQRNEGFSTNWLAAGAQRSLGSRGLVLFRGRVSAEPMTIKEAGYPQMLQYVSPENGGPLLDSMRAHDLVGEAAVQLAFRMTHASYLSVYAAPVGDPALGALPYAQRASSEEFVEAPFAYDVQETTHDSTRVVTAGFGSQYVTLEASVFHDAVTTGRHTTIPSGDIDSRSARLTLTPTRNVSIQVSRGELGDAERELSSASISLGTQAAAVSAIWTRRDTTDGVQLTAGAIEGTFRAARNTFSARVEAVDRPAGFLGNPNVERTTHFTLGYLFDVVMRSGSRAGFGANVDYHTQTHDLANRYGHKPQAVYLFARVRTAP